MVVIVRQKADFDTIILFLMSIFQFLSRNYPIWAFKFSIQNYNSEISHVLCLGNEPIL